MPKNAPPDSIPLTPVPHHITAHSALSSLQPPDYFNDADTTSTSADSDLVHLSKETSRQGTPFTDLPHPDAYPSREKGGRGGEDRDRDREYSSDFGAEWEAAEEDDGDMPSDLRPGNDHKSYSQPLLSSDKARQSYDGPIRPSTSRRSSRLRERDPVRVAQAATRKRYTIAAGFLLVSLVTFAIQTETAVYIQHNLGWTKAYCMLYVSPCSQIENSAHR